MDFERAIDPSPPRKSANLPEAVVPRFAYQNSEDSAILEILAAMITQATYTGRAQKPRLDFNDTEIKALSSQLRNMQSSPYRPFASGVVTYLNVDNVAKNYSAADGPREAEPLFAVEIKTLSPEDGREASIALPLLSAQEIQNLNGLIDAIVQNRSGIKYPLKNGTPTLSGWMSYGANPPATNSASLHSPLIPALSIFPS